MIIMKNRQINLLARLIPALAVIGNVFTLSFLWTDQSNRNGAFYYFICLMTYAAAMLFFSDIIFLSRKKPLPVRVPLTVVASIHIAYIFVLLLLRIIFVNIADVYFVLATLGATGIQLALSLRIYMGVNNITGQQNELTQQANARAMREILLTDMNSAFKNSPALAVNAELTRKLQVLINTWKTSSPKDTEDTAQATAEIDASIQALTGMVSSGEAGPEAAAERLTAINALIERRNKLLTLK